MYTADEADVQPAPATSVGDAAKGDGHEGTDSESSEEDDDNAAEEENESESSEG